MFKLPLEAQQQPPAGEGDNTCVNPIVLLSIEFELGLEATSDILVM